MKLKHSKVKSVKLSSRFGELSVDANGICEVPDEAGPMLCQSADWTVIEEAKAPPEDVSEAVSEEEDDEDDDDLDLDEEDGEEEGEQARDPNDPDITNPDMASAVIASEERKRSDVPSKKKKRKKKR